MKTLGFVITFVIAWAANSAVINGNLIEIGDVTANTSSVTIQFGQDADGCLRWNRSGAKFEYSLNCTDFSDMIYSAGSISDLTDVAVVNPTPTQILTWDGAKWKNDDAPEGGGGAGDADSILMWNMADRVIGDFDLSGNNADFDGGGTISAAATMSTTAADLIGLTQSLHYDPDADGSDDYFGVTVAIPQGYRGRDLKFQFEYKNDAGGTTEDADFRFAVKQKDGSNAGYVQYFDMDAYTPVDDNAMKWNASGFVMADCTEIEIGWQNTDTTTTISLTVDNLLVSKSAFVEKNILESQYAKYDTHAGFGSSSNKIPYYTNASGDAIGIVTIGNSPTLGLTITCSRPVCNVSASYSMQSPNGAGADNGWSLNSSQLTTTFVSITQADKVGLGGNSSISGETITTNQTVNIRMVQGDIIRPHTDADTPADTSRSIMTVLAWSETDAVVHADNGAQDWENTFGVKIANNGTATITSQSGGDAVASVSRTAEGIIDITFTSGFFTVTPALVIVPVSSGYFGSVTAISTSSATVHARSHSGGLGDYPVEVIIQRQGTDYKNKAAAIITPLTETCYVYPAAAAYRVTASATTSYKTYVLDHLVGDCPWLSLSSNTLSVPKGKYEFTIGAGCYGATTTVDIQIWDTVLSASVRDFAAPLYCALNTVSVGDVASTETFTSAKVISFRSKAGAAAGQEHNSVIKIKRLKGN